MQERSLPTALAISAGFIFLSTFYPGQGVLPTRHTDVKTPNLMTGKCLALAYKQL